MGINMDLYNYTEVPLVGIISDATIIEDTDDPGPWVRTKRYVNILDHLDDSE